MVHFHVFLHTHQITQNFVQSSQSLYIPLKWHEHRTEAVVTVSMSTADVETEQTGIGRKDVIASTDEEWTSRTRKVRVVAVP